MYILHQVRYPCSKNKSGKINFKFAIFVISIILNCGIYQQIETNSGFYLIHCFFKSLILIFRYHHFTYRAANQQSLSYHTGMMTKGCIVARVLPLRCFLFLLPNYIQFMQLLCNSFHIFSRLKYCNRPRNTPHP